VTHPLLATWKSYEPTAPYILDSDRHLLGRPELIFRAQNWKAYIGDPDFGSPKTKELCLDLLPMPFVGDVENAVVSLLMLNPGLVPSDYFGEFEVKDYRNALLENLKQTAGSQLLFLDPRFSWHGGFVYWHTKLAS
jgi:hypothetical protein